MKKLSWILIITLLASCLSACGKKETVIYQGDTASTSDATDDPIRNLDYTVPGDKGTLTVQAQVDTSLAEKSAPVASLSRADFTDEDIQAYADLIFDEGSYSLFMPYDFRSIEDLTSACGAWEDTFKSYEDFSTIPEYMIAEYYDATDTLSGKQHDTDAAKRVVETDGEIKWYISPYNPEDDPATTFKPHKFCILQGTIRGEHYYLAFLQNCAFCRMIVYKDYTVGSVDFSVGDLPAFPIEEAFLDTYDENICTYSDTEARQVAEDYLKMFSLTDYAVQTTLNAYHFDMGHYSIDDSMIVTEPQTDGASVVDSYLVYACRNLNGLSAPYTTELLLSTLTDYSNADIQGDDSGYTINFPEDEAREFYGYESLTANVDSDGLSYLIWNNPMKVDSIKTEHAATLSFDQIDAVAQAYIDSCSVRDPYSIPASASSLTANKITVHNICYGLIRISDADHRSYSLTPAWFYLEAPDKHAYTTQTAYVIISAIDGSIYNPWLGTLEHTDNNQTKE